MTALADCSVEAEPELPPPDAARMVEDVSGLISPPRVCVKMFELVHSARASAEEIGDVVALDPNLAARLLRIVNSSFYGFPSRVDSISRAVTILGTSDLYNLVLAISAVRSFSKLDAGLVRMETFWHHSIFCALVARELAKQCRFPGADRLFVAGLLHDIGTCVIYSQRPDWAQRMRPVAQSGEALLHDTELQQLGFSHACVGALVLEQWQLPVELQSAVQYHHKPSDATIGQTEAALIQLADTLANSSDVGALAENPSSLAQVDDAVWEILGTDPELLDSQQILSDANANFWETTSNLMPSN